MIQFIINFVTSETGCYSAVFVIGSILYALYLYKYKFYIFLQKDDITEERANKPRGKCPPFYPNGWYSLYNSDELKPNDVKYIDYCGRDVVLFRGTNGVAYALSSFCSHMGANLGYGGKVKNDSCIQCPFHGWTFDGNTGNCVHSFESLGKKPVNQFQYHDLKEQTKVDGEYLHKCYEGAIKLKKYHLRELNNSILVWFDSREEYQDNIQYEPLDIDTNLSPRGESINFVNCHCSEIPENGADLRHFDFLHTRIFDYISFIKFDWLMKSHRAAEPDIFEHMAHKDPFFNDYKMKLMRKYITEENKKFMNIIYLDCYIVVFKWRFFVFNLTGFQCGPALVYLFLKSKLFEITMAQSVTVLKKFKVRVSHKIYTSSYLPYWLSAYMLYGEVKQLFSDISIWNNKNFGAKLNYNLKTDADKNLLSWRNWFSQFYEGCHEFEKEKDKLSW